MSDFVMRDIPAGLDGLRAIMAQLRDPEGGCPWDQEQTFDSIVPFTVEETYEVIESIEQQDWQGLKGELGDLLFHVVFYSRMAEEAGLFDLDDVLSTVNEKLIRRHPHVFADAEVGTAQEQTEAWESIKAEERRQAGGEDKSIFTGIGALPGFVKAEKLQRRCSRVGFDWPDIQGPMDKVEEEVAEIREVVEQGADQDRLSDELGDLFFAGVNLARHARVDPEQALRQANRKFENRFRKLEALIHERGQSFDSMDLMTMDALWDEVKQDEGDSNSGNRLMRAAANETS